MDGVNIATAHPLMCHNGHMCLTHTTGGAGGGLWAGVAWKLVSYNEMLQLIIFLDIREYHLSVN